MADETPVTPKVPTIKSVLTNGDGNLSFGRTVGGLVTILVVGVCVFSVVRNSYGGSDIDWQGMGSFMKDSVYLVLASYGTTKGADVLKSIWGQKA